MSKYAFVNADGLLLTYAAIPHRVSRGAGCCKSQGTGLTDAVSRATSSVEDRTLTCPISA